MMGVWLVPALSAVWFTVDLCAVIRWLRKNTQQPTTGGQKPRSVVRDALGALGQVLGVAVVITVNVVPLVLLTLLMHELRT